MLSRIAESLYWLGRYVERAEDTARILEVHVLHLLEDPSVSEEAACRSLLGVMGIPDPGDGPCDAARVTEILAFDPAGACSIVGALVAARQSARGIREVLSSEMWECLNATYNALPTMAERATQTGPHGFFQYVKERAAVLAGLADSTLSRDDGWRFLVLGRSLERLDMTTRLLLAQFSESTAVAEWVTTLACCSAYEAYLRTYRRGVEASLVAEFLLLDRLFPRSAFHALTLAEQCLAELEPAGAAARAGLEDEARRILGRARVELEFRRLDELIADLPVRLNSLQAVCAQASDAVTRRYFRLTAPLEWSLEGAGTGAGSP